MQASRTSSPPPGPAGTPPIVHFECSGQNLTRSVAAGVTGDAGEHSTQPLLILHLMSKRVSKKNSRPFWPGIKARSEKAINKFVRDSFQNMPLFRNEKDFLPLQAADLYAWQVRRNWNNNQSLYMPPNHALRKLWSIPGFDRVYNESEIKFMGELKRSIARKVLAFDPTLRWVSANENANIRKANRKRAKKKPQKIRPS